MKTFGGNSGYIGYSMSKRAANARNEGAYPKTDFKKEYGLTAKVFDALKDLKIIYVSEWHHTSKFGNRTDFYRWNEDKYINIYEQNEKEIKKLRKKSKLNKRKLSKSRAIFAFWKVNAIE